MYPPAPLPCRIDENASPPRPFHTPHPPMSISIDQNAQLAQFVRFADAAADKDVVS